MYVCPACQQEYKTGAAFPELESDLCRKCAKEILDNLIEEHVAMKAVKKAKEEALAAAVSEEQMKADAIMAEEKRKRDEQQEEALRATFGQAPKKQQVRTESNVPDVH